MNRTEASQGVEAWNEASRQLGIRVVAPFALSAGHVTAACIAFLPDFGGRHGMVIGAAGPPAFETDPALIECARASGLFCSFLHPDRYATFDAEVFKDALKDWGYFGSAETRPEWCPSDNFTQLVVQKFGFLDECGFKTLETSPTIVRYQRGDLELDVYYSRRSFEIGFEIGHGNERFSMSEVIRAVDPVAADQYRDFAARTPGAIESGVARLCQLVRRYGERALRDEPELFAVLRGQRTHWSEGYALDVLAEQVRPKAEAAFRERRYGDAAELYETIAPRLTPAEQHKLAIARKRAE